MLKRQFLDQLSSKGFPDIRNLYGTQACCLIASLISQIEAVASALIARFDRTSSGSIAADEYLAMKKVLPSIA